MYFQYTEQQFCAEVHWAVLKPSLFSLFLPQDKRSSSSEMHVENPIAKIHLLYCSVLWSIGTDLCACHLDCSEKLWFDTNLHLVLINISCAPGPVRHFWTTKFLYLGGEKVKTKMALVQLSGPEHRTAVRCTESTWYYWYFTTNLKWFAPLNFLYCSLEFEQFSLPWNTFHFFFITIT